MLKCGIFHCRGSGIPSIFLYLALIGTQVPACNITDIIHKCIYLCFILSIFRLQLCQRSRKDLKEVVTIMVDYDIFQSILQSFIVIIAFREQLPKAFEYQTKLIIYLRIITESFAVKLFTYRFC